MTFVRNLELIQREYTPSSIAKAVLDSNAEIPEEVAKHLRTMVASDYMELYVPVTADYRLYGSVFNEEAQEFKETPPHVTGEEYKYTRQNDVNFQSTGFLTPQDAFSRRSQLINIGNHMNIVGAMMKIGCMGQVSAHVYVPNVGGLSIGIRPETFVVVNRIKPQGIQYAIKDCYSGAYNINKLEANTYIIRYLLTEFDTLNGRQHNNSLRTTQNKYYSKYFSKGSPSQLNITGNLTGIEYTEPHITETDYGTVLDIGKLVSASCINVLAPNVTVLSPSARAYNRNIIFKNVSGILHGKAELSNIALHNNRGSIVSVAGDGNNITTNSRDTLITVLGSTNTVAVGHYSSSTVVSAKGNNNIVSVSSRAAASVSIDGYKNTVNCNGSCTHVDVKGKRNHVVIDAPEHRWLSYASIAIKAIGESNVITIGQTNNAQVDVFIKASHGTVVNNAETRIVIGETEGYPVDTWFRLSGIPMLNHNPKEVYVITDYNDPMFNNNTHDSVLKVVLDDINGGNN